MAENQAEICGREKVPGISEEGITNEAYSFGGLNQDGANNYVILDAAGHGHYVGSILCIYNQRRSTE